MTAGTKSAKMDIEQEAIMFETGKFYTWRDIRAEIGGDGKQWYLPTVNGRVVAGCFKRSPTTNPDAPDIILPGNGPFIKEAARRFTAQGSAVPIFIKQAVNHWKYVGMYKVARQSFNKGEINQHAAKANRVNDVSSVLFLRLFVEECEIPYTSPTRRTVMFESTQSSWKSKHTIAND